MLLFTSCVTRQEKAQRLFVSKAFSNILHASCFFLFESMFHWFDFKFLTIFLLISLYFSIER